VIQYLRDQGYTQARIAKMLHVTEGFVTLVKNRERSLTLDHFELLASALSMPVGALMIAVSTPTKVTGKSKPFYDRTARILRLCDELQEAILRGSKPVTRKSA
jgi:transcriptional regulator with XRE-family HTH domain